MQDIHANEIDPDTQIAADVCIVGSGAAGLAIAHALMESRLRVVVMESGRHEPDPATQALTEFESVGAAVRAVNEHGLESRLRCLGGTTNTWGGRCARLNEIDFTARDWVENSGWPIQAHDLAPFYDRAEALLSLPNRRLSAMSSGEQQLLQEGTLKTVEFLFANQPVSMKTAYWPDIRRSANVQIILQANATEIEPEPGLRTVRCVHFRTLSGKTFSVKATKYILACGGWENPRLLLLSRRHGDRGLGNEHDLVGRYYNEHPILQHGTIDQPQFGIRSPQFLLPTRISGGYVKQGLRLSDDVQTDDKLLNHYIDLVPVYAPPLQALPYARNGFYRLLPRVRSLFSADYWQNVRVGAEFVLAQFGRRSVRRPRLAVINHLEQPPCRESRVTLSDEKDRLGLNRLRVDLRVSEQEKASLIRFHEILRDVFVRQQLGEFSSTLVPATEPWDDMTDSFHHMGTTRMCADPKKGVVDATCCVHGIDNLYVSGSSVFPTSGCVNPTLTIVALALRLADFLKKSA